MARKARVKSSSGIYHVMFRGVNRQDIFHDDDDRRRFLEILKKYKKKMGLQVYAWCLMSNHIHVLLKEGEESISATMKRVGVSYAVYYNWKYRTSGHVFQNRFNSEIVENDAYFLTVVRYIHQNPVKAGWWQRWMNGNGAVVPLIMANTVSRESYLRAVRFSECFRMIFLLRGRGSGNSMRGETGISVLMNDRTNTEGCPMRRPGWKSRESSVGEKSPR
ncbi:transposase [Mesobacillus boroniphilus]|uniref:Transposase IS200-like domain-containing protein n=1 Tax=Mesobacillus boroniphilus JCM 21738 TaxID=1294265 RepID=W4RUJ3_9BACI|nr:transposase [Mesobacillus boroniphilus]GAE47324.1 hypothetical protein JCM21738_4292 [Mesobacillus boroniphilus JCM 21738]